MLMKNTLIITFLSGFLATGSPWVVAQEELPIAIDDNESKLIKRKSIIIIKKRTEKEKTKGVVIGKYIFQPSIMISEYYDDNIYAQETGKKNDLITVFTPKFNLKSDWSKHQFNLNAGIEITRHADFSTENTENGWLKLNGKYDISKLSHLFAGVSYARDHEDRGTEDPAVGYYPVKFEDSTAHLGYSVSKKNNSIKLIYSNKELDYYDVDSDGGIIDNDDRDRNESALGIQYMYKYSANTAVFINGIYDLREYITSPDNNGDFRDSNGWKSSVGLKYASTSVVSKIYFQNLARDYESLSFADIDESNLGLQFSWKILPSSILNIKTSSSIEETTINTSPGYLKEDASIGLNIALNKNRKLNFYAMKGKAQYYVITRNDKYMNYGLGYDAKISSNLYMSVDLHRAERDSNIAGQDYISNQVLLRLKGSI
jgi:hypothetical protein